jgi:hypothetical protein
MATGSAAEPMRIALPPLIARHGAYSAGRLAPLLSGVNALTLRCDADAKMKTCIVVCSATQRQSASRAVGVPRGLSRMVARDH